jgi:hypothetical protein
VRKGTIDLKAYLKSKSIDIDWSEAEAFRGPPSSSVSLYYTPGVAFPILKRSLGLLPPETPSPENGNTPGAPAPGAMPGAIPGPTHDQVQDQDQELDAALLI